MMRSFKTMGIVGCTCLTATSLHAIEIDIHGFASQSYFVTGKNEYLVDDSSGGSFAMNEAGINFAGDLTDDLRVGLQLYARDLGEFGNNTVNLDWAFLDYSWRPELGIRAGKIKLSSGFWREYQDYDFTRAWAFLPTGLYDPAFRDLSVAANGFSGYGYYDMGSAGGLSYQGTIGTVSLDNNADLETLLQGSAASLGSVSQLSHAKMDYIGNLQLMWETPIEGLRLNGTIVETGQMEFVMDVVLDNSNPILLPPPLQDPTINLAGNTASVDIEFEKFGWYIVGVDYTWEDWYFVFEYGLNQQKFEQTTTVRVNNYAGGFGTTDLVIDQVSDNQFSEAMYWGGSYRLNDNWQFGSYLELYYADRDDRLGKQRYDEDEWRAYRYDLALSARYDVNENWLWKLEVHGVQGTAGGVTAIPDEDLSEYWWYAAIKTTVNF